MDRFRLSRRTIQEHIKKMVEIGYWERHTDRLSNRSITVSEKYKVTLYLECQQILSFLTKDKDISNYILGAHLNSKRGAFEQQEGAHLNSKRGAFEQQEEINNLKINDLKNEQISQGLQQNTEREYSIISSNNILINNTLSSAHVHTHEMQVLKDPGVTVNKIEWINADSLNMRLSQDDKSLFMAEHNGQDFPSREALKAYASSWKKLRAKNNPNTSKPLGQRKEQFHLLITQYQQANPGEYPEPHYKEFVEYWSCPLINEAKGQQLTDKTLMRFEAEKTFDIGRRLAFSYKNIYLKNHPHGTDKSKPSSKSRGKEYAFVDLEAAIAAKAAKRGYTSEAGIIDAPYEDVE